MKLALKPISINSNDYFAISMLSLAAFSCAFFGSIAIERVLPQFQFIFFLSRLFSGVSCLLAIVSILLNYKTQWFLILSLVGMQTYAFVGVWLLALYEMSFVQVSFAFLFVKKLNAKITLQISTFFLILIFASYPLQSYLGWQKVLPIRDDFIAVAVVFTVMAIFTKKFIFDIDQKINLKQARYAFIGKEAIRTFEQVQKLIDQYTLSFKADIPDISKKTNAFDRHLFDMQNDLNQIQNAVKNINRLVISDFAVEPDQNFDLSSCLNMARFMLRHQLSNVEFVLNLDSGTNLNNKRLLSVFFNLILNSIEAFKVYQTNDPKIFIKLESNTLIYTDNAISGSLRKEIQFKNENNFGSKIGREMIFHDLQQMSLNHNFKIHKENYQYEIHL